MEFWQLNEGPYDCILSLISYLTSQNQSFIVCLPYKNSETYI
jgi:hypothetical protein